MGSERGAIIIKAKGAYLVGPDNGLLAPAAERLGVEKVYRISKRDLLPEKLSDVFDGRDTFGPTGALLAKGVDPEEIGHEVEDYIRSPMYECTVDDGVVEATVIHVDGFGNLVTNVTYEVLDGLGAAEGSNFKVSISVREFTLPYVRRFSAVPEGDLLLLVAGGGYMELAVNQGNAGERLGIGRGETLKG
ncbi:Adenosyl-chloride synthase [subsurface metagenome]